MKKAVLSLALFAAFSGAAVAAPAISAGVTGSVVGVPDDAFLNGSRTTSGLSAVYSFFLSANAGSLAATFNSVNPDSSLVGALYRSDASGALLGTALTSASAVQGNTLISYGAITSGYYALSYSARGNGASTLYSGQLITNVPAPAALGLAGLGLVGLGLFSRRRAV